MVRQDLFVTERTSLREHHFVDGVTTLPKGSKSLKFHFHGVLQPERHNGRDSFWDALVGVRDLEGTARTMVSEEAFFRVPEFVDLGSKDSPWLAGRFARYATDLDVVIGDVEGGFAQVNTDDTHGAQSPESYFLYDPSLRVLCFQNNPQAHVKRFESSSFPISPSGRAGNGRWKRCGSI